MNFYLSLPFIAPVVALAICAILERRKDRQTDELMRRGMRHLRQRGEL